MKLPATLIAIFLLHGVCSATEWIIPEPVTYEWTVKQTQRELPRVDLTDTSIEWLIDYLGNSMNYPIRLQHNLSEAMLEKRVDWKLTKVKWIDLVAKIADISDADILIGKRVVTLNQRKPTESDPGSS